MLDAIAKMFPFFEDEVLAHKRFTVDAVDTGGNKPIKQRQFSASPGVQKLFYTEIAQWLALEIIDI